MKERNVERSVRDPVCGMELSRKSAPEELVYGGKTYNFCVDTCRKEFEADPEKHIPHHRQHGMKQK